MAKTLIFDAVFADENGVGQQVDSDIKVEIYDVEGTLKETRLLGTDPNTEIKEASGGSGIFYTTTVDVTDYLVGAVTAKWYAKVGGTQVDPYPFEETLPYPVSGVFTENDIREYIRNFLGWPRVAVELEPSQYAYILQEALAFYNAYNPIMKFGVLDYVEGQDAYYLPDVPARGIFRVEFIRKMGSPYMTDPMFGREFPRGHPQDFDTYVLSTAHWKTLNRVGGLEPEWKWDRNTKTLYVSSGPPAGDSIISRYYITYYYYDDNALETIPSHHYRAIYRYCLALAKEVLAQVRGKFGGAVPAPGGQLTLNYSDLQSQAEQEKEKIEEEIKGFSPPVPPMRY